MKQNNKKFNNAMHTFVGVLDKYAMVPWPGGKFDSVAILEGGEGLEMSGPPSWKYPEVIWMSFPHSLLGLSFHER